MLARISSEIGVSTMLSDLGRQPATAADFEAVRVELERLRIEVAALRVLSSPAGDNPRGPPRQPVSSLPEQLVTLDQIGAMVHRSKRSMERYRSQMPHPRVRGRRGQPHLWAWTIVRPWLEETFSIPLPDSFPGFSH